MVEWISHLKKVAKAPALGLLTDLQENLPGQPYAASELPHGPRPGGLAAERFAASAFGAATLAQTGGVVALEIAGICCSKTEEHYEGNLGT